MPPKKQAASADVFEGDTFCVSGAFTISQSEMKELIIKNGGHIAATPNKTCAYLVADSMGSSKTAKAAKDGIAIVTEDWVHTSIKAGKKSTDASLFLSGGPAAGGAKKTTAASKKKAAKNDDEDEEEDEEEEEEEKPKKKAAGGKKGAAAASKKGGDVFDGEVFCVSGKFSISQGDMCKLIEQNGGTIVGTPNKQCTFLVADSIGSAKTVKAQKDGIDIVTEDWVNTSIANGKKSTDSALFLSGGGAAAGDDDEEEEEEEEEEEAPKKKAAPKRKAAAKKADDEEDEEEEEDDEPTSKKAKSTASNGSSSGSSSSAANIKTVVVKGSAPVDDKCPKHSTTHVYAEGSNVYDAMLNQTNIGQNNNKFYVIQLLETDAAPKQYFVWNRWGRVGATGQNALEDCGGNLARAKASFDKKFHDKTKNHWSNRANFVEHSGKYTLLERDYNADDDDEPAASPASSDDGEGKSAKAESKLDSRVQDLVKLICDLKMMKDAMLEVGYDANKMPLGKLSKEHIKKGYEVLQELSTAINNDRRSECVQLSNRFYTLIPHVVGMRPPPVINNVQLLKEKLTMVESLADVAIATKLLRADSMDSGLNPVDLHYQRLKCDFKPLERKSDEFQMVVDYTKNTHGSTHRQYTLEVLDVFNLDREGETARFSSAGYDSVKNTQLLWHGSRLTNFVGIISQGLRIAPPEAPVTGYMFGKGVYFADMVSKSANYCNASRGSDTACMLLCEVALGEMNELTRADYHASNLPTGKLSTKGLGQMYPDPAGERKLPNGVVVPMGKEVKGTRTDLSLLYNEYIVYDVAQIKCKYLVKLKFKY